MNKRASEHENNSHLRKKCFFPEDAVSMPRASNKEEAEEEGDKRSGLPTSCSFFSQLTHRFECMWVTVFKYRGTHSFESEE